MPLTEPHDEFLELCAVSTSGQLTEGERERLQEHLAICESCRETLKQYESVVDQAIPVLVVAKEASKGPDTGSDWSEDQRRQAEKAFFNCLAQTHKSDSFKDVNDISVPTARLVPFSSELTWRHVCMLNAVGVLLFASFSFYAYWAGVHRGAGTARHARLQRSTQGQPTLEVQLSDAAHEREIAREQIEQRNKTIADLRRQLAARAAQINDLKAAQEHMEEVLRAADASSRDLAQQRNELAQKLSTAQFSSQELQQSTAQQSAQDATRAKALDIKVNDLNRLLHDREVALDQKDELLAHDRDIRELMGARDLYVAEVYDVLKNGETQKPYGRVFYTKGKSLIFYAYDLDRQTELKQASTFQAWGSRGPDRQQALNLGVFYEDSASRKRWILKCDDATTLAQIDAVFVTVEPHSGSQKPSGKSLLFAYLKGDSNHP